MQTGRVITGARLVAEAAYRRLSTPRGTLRGGEEEADYGIDLTEYIGEQANASTAAIFPAVIRNELLKDERIESVDVDVTYRQDGPGVLFEIDITCTTAEGPFTLQVGVSSVTTGLLGITEEAA